MKPEIPDKTLSIKILCSVYIYVFKTRLKTIFVKNMKVKLSMLKLYQIINFLCTYNYKSYLITFTIGSIPFAMRQYYIITY